MGRVWRHLLLSQWGRVCSWAGRGPVRGHGQPHGARPPATPRTCPAPNVPGPTEQTHWGAERTNASSVFGQETAARPLSRLYRKSQLRPRVLLQSVVHKTTRKSTSRRNGGKTNQNHSDRNKEASKEWNDERTRNEGAWGRGRDGAETLSHARPGLGSPTGDVITARREGAQAAVLSARPRPAAPSPLTWQTLPGPPPPSLG